MIRAVEELKFILPIFSKIYNGDGGTFLRVFIYFSISTSRPECRASSKTEGYISGQLK